jgi:hypothetical protein
VHDGELLVGIGTARPRNCLRRRARARHGHGRDPI